MSIEENKAIVRRFYEALEREDYEAAASMCGKNFVFWNQVDTPRAGVEGFIAAEKKHLDCFEGFKMGTLMTVAEGDWVAAYVLFEGPHTQEFYGVKPRGNNLRMTMGNFFKIVDGKIVEKRAHYDRMDHVEQLTAEI